MKLPVGLPNQDEYFKLIRSKLFANMENYSNSFIKTNKLLLYPYIQKWIKDPFHQWSRQWEYPYVYSQISSIKGNLEILDAGSGVTFLPFFIASSNCQVPQIRREFSENKRAYVAGGILSTR